MKHLLMLAALLAGTVSLAENLLQNGNMKTNKGWSLWGSYPSDRAIRTKILTYVNDGPNGGRALRFEDFCDDHNPYLIQWAPVSDITAETQFKLTFSLKAAKGQVIPVALQMIGPAPDKKYLGICSCKEKVVGTGKWKRYTLLFRKPQPELSSVAVLITPVAKPWAAKTQTGSFLLTDVSLEQIK